MAPTETRLYRSELCVPASNVRMLEKTPALGADVVMLDLEDALAPDDKEQARINLPDALGGQDWTGSSVSVRINGLDTHWCYRDIVHVVERAGERIDAIVIPKVSGAETCTSSPRCSPRSRRRWGSSGASASRS